jgi:tetratricopeptide (TPR) repeat protein
MSNVQKLEQLEQRLLGPRGKLQASYRRLGHLKSDLGFPASGLADVLRAYALYKNPAEDRDKLATVTLAQLTDAHLYSDVFPVPGTPFELAVQLGEGLRLYSRDVQFSKDSVKLAATLRTLELSLACFDHALNGCSTERVDQQAWLLAHRAAAITMLFWVKDALEPKAVREKRELFESAKRNFDDALKLQPKYAWCRRFLAFLLTLEGSDFEKAEAQLKQARAEGATNDSSLERSRAILFLNLAGETSREEQYERARQSLDAATEAVRLNTEDNVGAYFAAASLSILAGEERQGEPAERAVRRYQDALSAVEIARTRSKNVISQAYATLICLCVLESHLYQTSPEGTKPPPEKIGQTQQERELYMDLAGKTYLDLETRVVFDREIRRLEQLEGVDANLKLALKDFLNKHFPNRA